MGRFVDEDPPKPEVDCLDVLEECKLRLLSLDAGLEVINSEPHNQYVCVCDTLLSSIDSLGVHVLGSERPSNARDPCPLIADKAFEIAKTKEVLVDDMKPINYWPAETSHDLIGSDEQESMEFTNEEGNGDEQRDEEGENDDDEKIDFQQMLAQNDRALQVAIKQLQKARADIQKLQFSVKNKQ
ncbi:hypothetical protein BGZ70_000571 [Mortierella alpina]|uniref:Uncharacterized protein n=1 Tax=Mortierella alpina TaxID=64518 RepID=A0A9P6IY63_MORAP|nr:hypothetical protein BGZ70_000571 [Mortierella alpina]